MILTNEIKKDIPGYEGLYQASNIGYIYNVKRFIYDKNGMKKRAGGHRLSSNPSSSGYVMVCLYKDGKPSTWPVHQLVAMTFLDHVPSGFSVIVDHFDNNKENNASYNLQLTSMRVNTTKDRFRGNYSSQYVGVFLEKNKKEGHKRWVSRISINKKVVHIGRFRTELEAHHAYQDKLNSIKP